MMHTSMPSERQDSLRALALQAASASAGLDRPLSASRPARQRAADLYMAAAALDAEQTLLAPGSMRALGVYTAIRPETVASVLRGYARALVDRADRLDAQEPPTPPGPPAA